MVYYLASLFLLKCHAHTYLFSFCPTAIVLSAVFWVSLPPCSQCARQTFHTFFSQSAATLCVLFLCFLASIVISFHFFALEQPPCPLTFLANLTQMIRMLQVEGMLKISVPYLLCQLQQPTGWHDSLKGFCVFNISYRFVSYGTYAPIWEWVLGIWFKFILNREEIWYDSVGKYLTNNSHY